jgi:hypothetical protein
MKSARDVLNYLVEVAADHRPECACDRCKSGRETFLLERDIDRIQLDAWAQGMADAVTQMNDMAKLYDDQPHVCYVLTKAKILLTELRAEKIAIDPVAPFDQKI